MIVPTRTSKELICGKTAGVDGTPLDAVVEDKIYYRIFSALKLNIIGYLIVNPSKT